MTKSWTNSSVIIHTIPRNSSVPVLNTQTLWPGPDGSSFYPWAGQQSTLAAKVKAPTGPLWKFKADGINGSWEQTPESSDPEGIHRTNGGAGFAVGDMAYYLGGTGFGRTDDVFTDPETQTPVPGVISFNFTSNTWRNDSSIGLNAAGTSWSPQTIPITALGSDNRKILVVIGGTDPGLIPHDETPPYWDTTIFLDFSNVTMYDPYLGIWLAQQATGKIPPPRTEYCAVVVKGDDETYEIFIYGGQRLGKVGFDDIYILTIPGFVWFQVPYNSAFPRMDHTCEVIGKRQMIVVGGIIAPFDSSKTWHDPDPFAQGLGIFDMTDLTWMSSYDANAAPYVTPEIVKDWYRKGGLSNIKWQSRQIARIFVRDSEITIDPTPQPVVDSQSALTSNSTNDNGLSRSDKIALGIGVPGLLATVAGVWLARKQLAKKKPRRATLEVDGAQSAGRVTGNPSPSTAMDGPASTEPVLMAGALETSTSMSASPTTTSLEQRRSFPIQQERTESGASWNPSGDVHENPWVA